MKHRVVLNMIAVLFMCLGAFGEQTSNSTDTLQQENDPKVQMLSPLDVKDADIQDVIRAIAKAYNLNVVLDNNVVGKVTVHLYNVTVIEGLEYVAKSNGYQVVKNGTVYRFQKISEEQHDSIHYTNAKLSVDIENIDVLKLLNEISKKTTTNIVADNDVTGKISGKLFEVDLEDGLRALLESNGFQVSKHKNIYQVTMASDPSTVAPSGQRGSYKPSNTSSLYVDYTNGRLSLDVTNASLQDLLKIISKKSDLQIITYGSISGEINAKIKDVPLTKALALLLGGTMFTFVQKDSIILIGDRNAATPAGQALSKSELVQLKCIKADGILQILPKDISAANVKVIKEQNALLVSGTSEEIVSMREFIATVDIPTPQVEIDAVIVEYSENLQTESGVNYWFNNDVVQAKSYLSVPSPDTKISTGSSAFETGVSGSSIKDLFSHMTGKTNKLITKIPDNFFVLLHLLESQNKAKVLAQPSIVTLNGNKASINVNETQYFKVTTNIGTNYETKFQPITFGIKLDITPWISQGGQITAEIAPEISNSDGSSSEGYPNVSSRTISTTVRLNDGESIALGGLIKNNEIEFQKKIPWLGNIPFLGNLFKYKGKTHSKTNLVIYITPHIIQAGAAINLDSALQSYDENFKKNAVKKLPVNVAADNNQTQKQVSDTMQTTKSESPGVKQPYNAVKNTSKHVTAEERPEQVTPQPALKE